MRGPMMALAAACVGLGLCAPLVARLMVPALAEWTRLPVASVHATLAPATRILTLVVASSLMLLALVCLLTALRRWLLTGRNVTTAVTWDCGYAAPTARMQYTASSFAQPLTHLLQALLRTRARVTRPDGILPRGAALATETPDLCRDRVYQPAFFHLNEGLAKLRWLQHGNVQLYVLYIALTLLALLLWKLR
jgi:hypothetical protein